MGPERWQTIENLFQATLACTPEERSTLLARECAGDEPLRREIESLIAHTGKATDFFDASLPRIAADLLVEDRAPLAEGQAIGHYRVIAPLGAGGMGEVYLARDTKLERKIALKILPSGFTRDLVRSLRFEHEARAASALNHPNIITIHEIGQSDGIRFMATEFIDGQTLRRRMAAGRMTVIEALDVACQVAGALAAAHDAEIVHRDIKPDNIMVRQDGLIKVLDFGLAKLIERDAQAGNDARAGHHFRTDHGMVMGTPHYMSPEQARSQQVDARADIFSLGVVLFEMMAGRLPFEGATTSDVIASILVCQPPPLSQFAPDVPGELVRIVSKALAKDKDGRYKSGRGLLADLRTLKLELEYRDRSKRDHQDEPPDSIGHEDGLKSNELDETPPGDPLPPPAAVATPGCVGLEAGLARIRHYRRVAAVSLLSLVVWIAAFANSSRERRGLEPATATIQRIAVLPFENLSGDPQQEYFSDGLTDDLITTLGQIKALNVISRRSVMRYKGSKKPLPEIAREINVNHLVEATAARAGNRIRINVRLVESATEQPLWSESYQRDIGDILTLQDEVAKAIAREVSAKLSPQEEGQFFRRRPVTPEAYDAYEMGQFHYNKRTSEGYLASVKYYEHAIEKDPEYALAYAGLALTNILGAYSVAGGIPQEEAISRARSATEKALRLNPMQAQAHAALGLICYRHDYDWATAEKEFRRAIELNPNYSEGYLWYADYLETMGRNGEAQERFRSAYLLDPMSPNIIMSYALCLAREGQFDQAIRMHRKSIELSSPGQWNTYLWLGTTYEQMGRYTEAIAEFQKALELSGGATVSRASLGHVYALSGKRIEAEKILNDLKRDGDRFNLAYLCTGLGRKDEAISWLEALYKGDRTGLFLLKRLWAWDPLRSDPRFQDLLRRLGLPPDEVRH